MSQMTRRTLGCTCFATGPPVKDQEVRHLRPPCPWYDGLEISLYCIGGRARGQSQTLRYTFDVRINRDALWLVAGVTQNDIRRFAPDAG